MRPLHGDDMQPCLETARQQQKAAIHASFAELPTVKKAIALVALLSMTISELRTATHQMEDLEVNSDESVHGKP